MIFFRIFASNYIRTSNEKLSDSNFITSGYDSKLKKWSFEGESWKVTHVTSYRSEPILNFDISEDGTILTACDRNKCMIFSASDLSFTDTLLPPTDENATIERVYHGRGKSNYLLLVKLVSGFYIW